MAAEQNPISRWSRLKQEARRQEEERERAKEAAKAEALKPPAEKEEALPPLPPVEELTPQSDFTGFMNPKVEDSVRRSALKKLFADPHFSIPDLNEAYSGDWTGGEPITPAMLRQLNQAYTLLFSDEEKKAFDEERARLAAEDKPAEQAAASTPQPEQDRKEDEPGRQDA